MPYDEKSSELHEVGFGETVKLGGKGLVKLVKFIQFKKTRCNKNIVKLWH